MAKTLNDFIDEMSLEEINAAIRARNATTAVKDDILSRFENNLKELEDSDMSTQEKIYSESLLPKVAILRNFYRQKNERIFNKLNSLYEDLDRIKDMYPPEQLSLGPSILGSPTQRIRTPNALRRSRIGSKKADDLKLPDLLSDFDASISSLTSRLTLRDSATKVEPELNAIKNAIENIHPVEVENIIAAIFEQDTEKMVPQRISEKMNGFYSEMVKIDQDKSLSFQSGAEKLAEHYKEQLYEEVKAFLNPIKRDFNSLLEKLSVDKKYYGYYFDQFIHAYMRMLFNECYKVFSEENAAESDLATNVIHAICDMDLDALHEAIRVAKKSDNDAKGKEEIEPGLLTDFEALFTEGQSFGAVPSDFYSIPMDADFEKKVEILLDFYYGNRDIKKHLGALLYDLRETVPSDMHMKRETCRNAIKAAIDSGITPDTIKKYGEEGAITRVFRPQTDTNLDVEKMFTLELKIVLNRLYSQMLDISTSKEMSLEDKIKNIVLTYESYEKELRPKIEKFLSPLKKYLKDNAAIASAEIDYNDFFDKIVFSYMQLCLEYILFKVPNESSIRNLPNPTVLVLTNIFYGIVQVMQTASVFKSDSVGILIQSAIGYLSSAKQEAKAAEREGISNTIAYLKKALQDREQKIAPRNISEASHVHSAPVGDKNDSSSSSASIYSAPVGNKKYNDSSSSSASIYSAPVGNKKYSDSSNSPANVHSTPSRVRKKSSSSSVETPRQRVGSERPSGLLSFFSKSSSPPKNAQSSRNTTPEKKR